jgi:lipoprotein-releasing system ATP-binding protein
MSKLFSALDIHKSYPTPLGRLEVLKGIELEIEKSEVIAIVGVSGVGKSTLLHILGTLDIPDKGRIFFREREINPQSSWINRFRGENLGFVFQFHYLLPELSAVENVILPALVMREKREKALEKAYILLERLNLEERALHKPSNLSFGEQQRVAIARALINDPEIILADEPTGNLDTQNAKAVFSLLYEIVKEKEKALILVTHNEELSQKADRIFRLKEGKLFEIKD